MNRTIITAAALLAGVAIAAPVLATPDGEMKFAQMDPDQRGGMGMRGGMPGMMGQDGAMEHEHDWRGGMMHRMMRLSPQQRCEERLARRTGIIAYTVAKLNLTAEQRPLWDKVQAQLQAASERERQLCATLKPPGEQADVTVLDRVNRREQFLQARLQAIQQIRPVLEPFYQGLTPAQKAIINHPFRP